MSLDAKRRAEIRERLEAAKEAQGGVLYEWMGDLYATLDDFDALEARNAALVEACRVAREALRESATFDKYSRYSGPCWCNTPFNCANDTHVEACESKRTAVALLDEVLKEQA